MGDPFPPPLGVQRKNLTDTLVYTRSDKECGEKGREEDLWGEGWVRERRETEGM